MLKLRRYVYMKSMSKVCRVKHSVQRSHRRTEDSTGAQNKYIDNQLLVVPRLAAAYRSGRLQCHHTAEISRRFSRFFGGGSRAYPFYHIIKLFFVDYQ